MTGRFEGQVAIITGGSGGIGSAVVRQLVRDGARVAVVDRVPPKQLDEGACFLEADVTQETEVQRYVQQAVEQFGRLDLFFNNAGIEGHIAPIVETKVEDFDRVQAVNVRGVFLGLREVLRVLQRQGSGGAIVNTASIAGLRAGAGGISPYVASKHAVIGLTRTAAYEAASFGVRVNAVAPGYINTRMLMALGEARSPGHAEQVLEAMATRVPLQRLGSPDEVANLVCWLLSSDASYITGSVHLVDAGLTS